MTIVRRLTAACILLLAASLAVAQAAPETDSFAPAATQSPVVPANAAANSKINQDEPQKTGDSGKRDKPPKDKTDDNDRLISKDEIHNPVLWSDPGNIAERDLYYGQGGDKDLPRPPFTFVDEDMNGSNPKFDALDANGTKWRVKLGEESRPEVVASRLLWAIGYFANDDYVLPQATVKGLKMHRKSRDEKGDRISFARFERKPDDEKKIGIWSWANNPFTSTREFNGLRVMMAVLNNWDLKDINNSVYEDKKDDRQIFLVNDIGASFGTTGISWGRGRSKGNINSYKHSKFITRETKTYVDFKTPSDAAPYLAFFIWEPYVKRLHMEWIGKNIPRADARWIGSLLGQLTHQQLVDAFRAGGFTPDVVNEYVSLVEGRIAELKAL